MDSQHKLRLCIPVCESTITAARQAIIHAASLADMIELRLDYLTPTELEGVDELQPLLNDLNLPVIVTLRPAAQGGARDLDFTTRNRSWLSSTDSPQIWRDVELDLLQQREAEISAAEAERLICSYHDFSGMPADLDHLYRQLAETPARVIKIAFHANDATDCLPLFHLLARAHQQGREMISIAMGPAGLATRILGPSRGAFLTYAALDLESASAAGQLTISELKTVYRIDKIDSETEITGLVGLPITHSVSPQIHNAALEAAGVNGVYIPFAVVDVAAFLKRMVHPRTREVDWNIRGLSITAPHKKAVIDSLDWVEPTAATLGAVNTIVVAGDELHGYNTDANAFAQAVAETFGGLRNVRCAVIGAGGAARAVVWALGRIAANVTVFARDESQARTLAQEFEIRSQSLTKAQFGEFDLVVNATPLGTAGELEQETPATAAQLSGARLACDLVYNPQDTCFLREARAAGCQTLSGLSMLVKQAAEQFKLWTGTDAPEQVMLRSAREALTKS